MPLEARFASRLGICFVMGISSSIHAYINSKGGQCRVYPAPFSVQLREDEDTIVEPDISVICDKNKLTDRGCVGAPDWVIEIISPSTASMDYVKKRELYFDKTLCCLSKPVYVYSFIYSLKYGSERER